MQKFVTAILLCLLALFSATSCMTPSKHTPQNVTLHFGQQGIEDFTTYTNGNVDVQPAGMSFFDLIWMPPNLGTVNIVHENHNLIIENVFSVLGSKSDNQKNDGITSIDIDAGLNKTEFIEPKQAYLAYQNLLTQINQKGWQQYYTYSQPRLAKEDNLRSIKELNEVIDPSHILTFKEWTEIFENSEETIKDLNFNLHLDGIVLWIWIRKTNENESGQEQYMLTISFETARYIARNSLGDDFKLDVDALKKVYEKSIKKDLTIRDKQESIMKEKGYHINEDYETPGFWEYMK